MCLAEGITGGVWEGSEEAHSLTHPQDSEVPYFPCTNFSVRQII